MDAQLGSTFCELTGKAADFLQPNVLIRCEGLDIRANPREPRLAISARHTDTARAIATSLFRLIERLVGEADGSTE